MFVRMQGHGYSSIPPIAFKEVGYFSTAGVLAWKSEGILNWLMLKPELETGLHYLYNAEYIHMHLSTVTD